MNPPTKSAIKCIFENNLKKQITLVITCSHGCMVYSCIYNYHCLLQLVICVVVLYVLIVVATEEKIHSHWCKTLGKDEASRERAVYLPHFQVGEMVTDLGYQNMQW